MIRLYLFGAPRLERDGRPVALRRTKALALLAYLAVSGQPQERDALLNLFWPEFDESSARNNLRRELSLLRTTLGETLLRTEGRQIALAPDATIWVDTTAFAAHLAAAQDPSATTVQGTAALAAAVDLAGAEFLAGFNLPDSPTFEEWQFFQRERLRGQVSDALAALVEQHRDRADYRAAIAYARRRLALDALYEPAQRDLIRLYALDGQHAAALRQYEACARLLETELGAAPEPETQALYAEVKARRMAPTASAHGAAPPSRPALDDLPPAVQTLIGRERECALIERLVCAADCRLLTLTGPGGVGKTQLALHAAQRLHAAQAPVCLDGVVFVALATVTNPELVLPAIMQALRLTQPNAQTPAEALSAFLRERRMVVILDNLEQVIAVAPDLAALAAQTPHVVWLITSREPLRVRDEQVVPVAPLALPPATPTDPQAALAAGAVQLFVRRAQQIDPDFAVTPATLAAITGICHRLDGLPLALELAAARTRMFGPQALYERLERRLPLLTSQDRDSVARHRTLRDALAWSYDLLSAPEQRLFRQLGVFVGGATLEAIAAVCELDEPATLELVEALLARNLLIQRLPDGEPRFAMLATIQEYAEDLLSADPEQPALFERHARYIAAWVEHAHTQLYGAAQQYWRARFVAEYANVRAVLQRARQRGDTTMLLRVAGRLGRFWGLQGYLREGRVWLEDALQLATDAHDAALRARVHLSLGNVCWMQSDLATAEAAFTASLALYQALDDAYGMAQARNGIGITLLDGARYAEARPQFAASLALFRALGDQERIATVLNNYAITLEGASNREQARRAFAESMALQQALGNEAGYSLALNNLSRIDYEEGAHERARELFQQSVALNRKLGNAAILSSALLYLGLIAVEQGEYGSAQTHLHEALDLAHHLGSAKSIVDALEGWAFLAAHAGLATHAVQFFAAAMRLREEARYFQELDDTAIAQVRERLQRELAADAWAHAWEQGRRSEPHELALEVHAVLAYRSRQAGTADHEVPARIDHAR